MSQPELRIAQPVGEIGDLGTHLAGRRVSRASLLEFTPDQPQVGDAIEQRRGIPVNTAVVQGAGQIGQRLHLQFILVGLVTLGVLGVLM